MTLETPEGIKHWLGSIGKDRLWLADRLRSTKGTVDQWFSKGFPAWAVEMIRLIQSQGDSKLQIRWTAEEWKEIQEAMANAGYTNEFSFFQDGILFFADSINKQDLSQTPPIARGGQIVLAAEPSVAYNHPRVKPAKKRAS